MIISLLHDAQEISILSGREKISIELLNEAFEKRNIMLHGFIKPGIKTLSKPRRISKNNQLPISENKNATIVNHNSDVEVYSENNITYSLNCLSIVDIVDQCKQNSYDVVEVLKQYFVVEEICDEGCKLC